MSQSGFYCKVISIFSQKQCEKILVKIIFNILIVVFHGSQDFTQGNLNQVSAGLLLEYNNINKVYKSSWNIKKHGEKKGG